MIEPLRLIYAGTPAFAVPALQALIRNAHQVLAVYTQPDRPSGRGRKLQASPVKQLAGQYGIPVHQPLTLRDSSVQAALAEIKPDVMIVAAYGLILPPEVLAIPAKGCINIHASLLPHWRGAAPIQRALMAGDSKTGITLMQMNTGLDTGDILLQEAIPIGFADTGQILHDALSQLGGRLLLEGLKSLQAGCLHPVPQDESKASYAKKITKEEAWLDWRQSAESLERQIRAFNPWPVAQTMAMKKGEETVLRIWNAHVLHETTISPPGTVLRVSKEGVDIATGLGIVRARELQWPGSRSLSAADFVNATDILGQCLKTIH